MEFPQPEAGQSLLYKASNLRRAWNNLLVNKLESMKKSVESELTTEKRETDSRKLENELWSNLATFMNSEILYTVKRLLPADLKVKTFKIKFSVKFIGNSGNFRQYTLVQWKTTVNYYLNSSQILSLMILNAHQMM